MTPDRLKAAFESQGRGCARLGSPFMGQLMQLFATHPWPDGPIKDRAFAWEGDVSAMGQSVPLRLAGALHALHLTGNAALRDVYPPHHVSDDLLWEAVANVFQSEAGFVDQFIDSAPQTNEVRRACVMIAVGHWLADRYDLPIIMRELGASAGLNLMWDQFALDLKEIRLGPSDPALTLWPVWEGPLPPAVPPKVVDRRGVDLNPLDPKHDALKLRAYLWPDQPERLMLTDAAISCHAATVDRGDAVDWLADQLAPRKGHLRLIYHTIAWQYFPEEAQARGTALIEAAGASATESTPLA